MSQKITVDDDVSRHMAWQKDDEKWCAEAGIVSPFISCYVDEQALRDYLWWRLCVDVIREGHALMKSKR